LLTIGVIGVVVGALLLFVARYLAVNYILSNSSSIDWWYKLSHYAGTVFCLLGLMMVAVYIISVFTKKLKKQ
jgi:hypothetical protein